jgi:hypothetical protein
MAERCTAGRQSGQEAIKLSSRYDEIVKTTIDIPDELYRRVKARSALEGRRVRDVTIELYERWLADRTPREPEESPAEWLDRWLRLADEATSGAPTRRSAREVLDADRGRLETPA